MAMTINTNIQSLNAQRNLTSSQSSLSTSMQRISSGMRINSAKDDAAGLAIATRMGTQITGLNQAARNANDGVSLAQTAEGALGTIGNNLQRIRELAVQSRNATNSTEDRNALQKEVTQLKSEIDRVSKDTAFNGTNLLDGSFTAKEFQVGANQGQTIKIDNIVNASVSQLGAWSSVTQPAAPESFAAAAGTAATLTAKASVTTAATALEGVGTSNNWKVNGVAVSFATGTLAADTQTNLNAALKDAGLDGVFAATVTGDAAAGVVKIEAKVDGTMVPPKLEGVKGGALTQVAGASVGDKTYAAADFKINGTTIKVGVTVGSVNRMNDMAKAINAEKQTTGVTASVEDGKLKLTTENNLKVEVGTAPATAALLTADTGLTLVSKVATPASQETGFENLDISTVAGSDNAILAMDAALKAVNSARADLGAMQNRFESVVSNLSVNSENLSASKSRIMDADFASETANLSRSQILQQAGTAMVAQANQLPQGVLSLLR